MQINNAIKALKYSEAPIKPGESSSTLSPIKKMMAKEITPEQNIVLPGADLVIACSKILNQRDQQLYKSIALYRLKK